MAASPPSPRTQPPSPQLTSSNGNVHLDIMTQEMDHNSPQSSPIKLNDISNSLRIPFPLEQIDDSTTISELARIDAEDSAFTQYIDNLDPIGNQNQMQIDAKEDQTTDKTNANAINPPETTATRRLPDWMTEKSAPALTKKSLFMNTQSRLRKKSELTDAQEIEPSVKYIELTSPVDIVSDRVICFDVETTGFAKTDEIIEIGAVEYIMGQRTGAMFQSYIKPTTPINIHASEVHGINNMMLTTSPSASIVIPSFLSWVGSSPLVAHNSKFDMRMLIQDSEKLGLSHLLENKKVFCTMNYYRKLFKGRPYALIDLYVNLLGVQRYASSLQICNPKLPNHSALVDAEIVGEVFLAEASLTLN